jgi:hypothetical protein
MEIFVLGYIAWASLYKEKEKRRNRTKENIKTRGSPNP